ncbi:polysaccharide deacetylase family protein [Evansella sp. AB-rgal1]|uniref:polysaccharide deacetylase family protein n=1 Tax=Evansella sp. AB-rgal1 TaxID=3242696 RepID=UPI00359D711B
MDNSLIIHRVPTNKKKVAITFDDGPNPVYTPQVLEVFQKVSGKATFYMIGEQMKKHPKIVQTVKKEGHEIANHTYTHPRLSQLSDFDCRTELRLTQEIIENMTGEAPATFRPPFLDYNEQTIRIIKEFGYRVIGAVNMEALDWEMPGVDHIVSKTRDQISNGSIFLFHDGFGDRSQTVEAVRILVNELTEEGYKLVTVSELFQEV